MSATATDITQLCILVHPHGHPKPKILHYSIVWGCRRNSNNTRCEFPLHWRLWSWTFQEILLQDMSCQSVSWGHPENVLKMYAMLNDQSYRSLASFFFWLIQHQKQNIALQPKDMCQIYWVFRKKKLISILVKSLLVELISGFKHQLNVVKYSTTVKFQCQKLLSSNHELDQGCVLLEIYLGDVYKPSVSSFKTNILENGRPLLFIPWQSVAQLAQCRASVLDSAFAVLM